MGDTLRDACGVITIDVEELGARTTAIIAQVGSGATYVVMMDGRPAAALIPIEDAKDHVLADDDRYTGIRRRSRGAYADGRTTNLKNLS